MKPEDKQTIERLANDVYVKRRALQELEQAPPDPAFKQKDFVALQVAEADYAAAALALRQAHAQISIYRELRRDEAIVAEKQSDG